jgi:hypothetical protein
MASELALGGPEFDNVNAVVFRAIDYEGKASFAVFKVLSSRSR